MKFLQKLLCTAWGNKTLLNVAEDLRKIGTYILGIAFIALIIQNNNTPIGTSIIGVLFGSAVWIVGILLGNKCQSEEENKQ